MSPLDDVFGLGLAIGFGAMFAVFFVGALIGAVIDRWKR